jgi:predicted MFS family arabinose efflux permease
MAVIGPDGCDAGGLPTGPDRPTDADPSAGTDSLPAQPPAEGSDGSLGELKEIPVGVYALLFGVMITMMAVVGQTTVLGKAVFDITGSELSLGYLGLAEFLPTALLAPVVGPVADRFDRRKVLALGLAGEATSSILLFSYIRTDPTSATPIFLIVVIFGAARALAAPAGRALPIDLAPRHVVQRVVAVNSVGFQIGIIVGPIVTGFLFVVDEALPYLFAAGAVSTAACLLVFVPDAGVDRIENPPGARAALVQALEGLRSVRGSPILLGAISLDLFAVLFGGAVALLPAIAEERLGVGAVGLGWLRAAAGLGAGLTALNLALRPVSRRVGRTLLFAVGVFGSATIVLGLTRSYALAFVALLVLGASDSISVFIRATLVPLATADSMRGRVLAVENVFIGASNELGAFESGVAAHFIGLVGAVVLGGAATLGVVVLWWARFPDLRDVDRFDEVRPDHEPL